MCGPRTIHDIDGTLWLYVGTEQRDGTPWHHLIGAKDGIALHRWLTDLPPEAVPVNDTEGRAEAEVFRIEADALKTERDALNEIMAEAVKLLPDREAERLRHLFLAKMERIEIKSR